MQLAISKGKLVKPYTLQPSQPDPTPGAASALSAGHAHYTVPQPRPEAATPPGAAAPTDSITPLPPTSTHPNPIPATPAQPPQQQQPPRRYLNQTQPPRPVPTEPPKYSLDIHKLLSSTAPITWGALLHSLPQETVFHLLEHVRPGTDTPSPQL